jgi:Xaa-Pro aminopeptidase
MLDKIGYQLDSIARAPLWADGLDFRHGVGHGVGAYLNVHEGPHGIGARESYKDVPFQIGMVVTNGKETCFL